jgi:hypothetical protein
VGLNAEACPIHGIGVRIGLVRPCHPLGRIAVSMETPCT